MEQLTPSSTPEEVRKAWIEALESGKYKQGKYHLHWKGEWCPLGVLADLARKAGVIPAKMRLHGTGGVLIGKLEPVAEWAGLNTPQGRFRHGKDTHSLTALNDIGISFPKIAMHIKRKPVGLFKK